MQSDISNGLRFRAVDPKFWHSPAASANGVNYLTAGETHKPISARPQRIYSGKIQTFQLLREY